ncbi:hypothetical protein TWF506_000057 [Arthrobotrys conoides]|uniref:BTB domain-containing protein n=1 Tax=Arthrobotrys conoides TaxID=74498 RepID=A0AAN8ND44_9PEZI
MADKKSNGRRGDFTSSSTNMADEADLSSLYFFDDPPLFESYRSYYQTTRKDMWKSISSRIPSQSEISDVSSVEDAASESTISGSPIRTDAYPDSEDFQSIINEYEGYEDPPCTLLPPTSFVTIADDYDCIITTSCERETRKFRVSEKVLSISSPVLRKLIVEAKDPTLRATKLDETDNGEFLGSDQDDSSTSLTLEGDPRAFEIVLQIIHYQEDDEKLENLEFDIFTQIVFLCEKYGWHKALRRWTRFWLEKYEPHALKPGYENWLYVTQVFKTKKDVAKLSKLLGESCGIFPARRSPAGPGEGRFLSRGGKVVDASLWPSDMFCK